MFYEYAHHCANKLEELQSYVLTTGYKASRMGHLFVYGRKSGSADFVFRFPYNCDCWVDSFQIC